MPQAPDPLSRQILGHPAGLYVLFFTEMWERFSYYGMRAFLILYLTKHFAMSDQVAGGIYGDYTGLVYLTPLLGGFLADRHLGLQRAILVGAVMMAAGHGILAWHAWGTEPASAAGAPSLGPFWAGLALLIVGNGMFKPNISTIVGQLYDVDDPRRDAAFTIFYMGINIGAMSSPLVVGWLAQRVAWHWGFAAAGIGMVLAMVIFLAGRHVLGGRGLVAAHHEQAAPAGGVALTAGQRGVLAVALLPGVLIAAWAAVRGASAGAGPVDVLRATLWPVIFSICVGIYVLLRMRCTREEMRRVNVIFVLGVFVLFFWAAFEQAGSSLTLFADRYTRLSLLGFAFPASWFQSVNAAFIILLAPFFSVLWVRLARIGREPSTPAKMACGLFLQAAAFAVMVVGVRGMADGTRVSPMWLVTLYLLQTCGELCLSPVGLSMVTRLAPVRYGALLMGVWFLSLGWANKLAGVGAGYLEPLGPGMLFQIITASLAFVGLVLVFCVPWLRRQMGGIH